MNAEFRNPQTIVEQQLDAYNAHDIEAFMVLWSKDAKYFEHPSTLLADGAAQIRERHVNGFRDAKPIGELISRAVLGNRVVDHEIVTRTFPEGRGRLEVIAIYEVGATSIDNAWFLFGKPDFGLSESVNFNISPTLVGPSIKLRPLTEHDRSALRDVAADPEIWKQHPASDRFRQEIFDPYFDYLLEAGGTLLALDKNTNQTVGCSRFYEAPDHPAEFGIGYTFLARSHWGGRWNKEMKQLMITHVLRSFPRVWFHIGPDNLRSQIATTRLGARFAYDAELLIGQSISSTKCYTLTRADWEAATGEQLPL